VESEVVEHPSKQAEAPKKMGKSSEKGLQAVGALVTWVEALSTTAPVLPIAATEEHA
jgi:hypothetical protein